MSHNSQDYGFSAVDRGMAADQANMRYHPMGAGPKVGSRYAGTRTEQIGVQQRARAQSKKYRSMESMGGAATNALKKNMHKTPKKPKRGGGEDAMMYHDRKYQEAAVGGKMRRKSY